MEMNNTSHDADVAYQNTLKWIHSTARFGSKLGLERTFKLLELLGNPQRETKFVHITGTNGKGSVTAMAASILQEAGYRTGMFISPYLEDFRERIMLNGKKISKRDLADAGKEVRKAVEHLLDEGFEHPTEFEINTAMALYHFAQKNCDYAVLEVGMGGRFDATNVVTPVVSVITTIDYDHMDRLGTTLPEIAFEKAGIIKPGVPVVTGVTEDESLQVIKNRASECGSDLTLVGKAPFGHITWTKACGKKKEEDSIQKWQCISVSGPGFEYENLKLPLLGDHQQLNALLALAALKVARVKPLKAGLPGSEKRRDVSELREIHLDEGAIRTGFAKTVWPGRLEIIHENPFIILDAAHNPQGAKVLSEFIKRISGRKIVGVLGILGDKCYEKQTAYIAPLCDEMIITKPHSPRALSPQILSQEARKYVDEVAIEEDSDKAMELAILKASSEGVVLCCGSLYLVGPARTFIRNKFGISPYGGE